MAMFYIGPDHNHDFSTDYHLSPILTPAHYLARFPPLLMQCGEKDPFCDDSVISARRVRKAKKTRLQFLLIRPRNRQGRHTPALRQERGYLARDGGKDWVQLDLFSGWSHGYLQMIPILPEAKSVTNDLGCWTSSVFASSFPGSNGERSLQLPLEPSSGGDSDHYSSSGSDAGSDWDRSEDMHELGNSCTLSTFREGQRLSQVELMRRRRLLDPHIFISNILES
ncbi:hypothetical protein BT96DRAFT_1021652 [Gymnopus androsaceus JB14]|uniref:Alpha/beta hydrolase fold-3 domain-containing protein n=1 Tax=Gymnopus androsaceus JB14 TaxID=1447944 RepID=A0A6A4HEA6_9AGAR|nr:hypothetical protein BT96DRAFT_1021652 [Gymnopus androsaceus JB14]